MNKTSPRRIGKVSPAPIGKPYVPPIGKPYAPPIKLPKGGKVPVTARALIQRLNRALHPQEEMLKTARGVRAQMELGDHYVLNWRLNIIIDKHVDIEELGREMGVLKDFEELEAMS